MSAPRKIWAVSRGDKYGDSRWSDADWNGGDLYHHDDVVRELAETLERAEMVMRMRGHLEMANECAAALAKIEQEG